MHAIIFDLPETGTIAWEIIASFGLADRVEFRAGDYLKDDYGRDNDLVLLSGVLHGEKVDNCWLVLRKVSDSLNPYGLVVGQETLLDDERAGPPLPVIFNPNITEGAAYTGQEVAGWMKEAGFAEIRVLPLTGYSWLNTLVLGKRPEA